jgi:D-serine deaminase-like pyridoxal phosphate-dependent protein
MKETGVLVTDPALTGAQVGWHKSQIETPALLLDLAAMERNLQQMLAFTTAKGVNLRPHVKSHKGATQLAHLQIQAGAIGVTCAKLSEAEAIAASGIHDILIANEIVDPHKIKRLVALAKSCAVKVAVDNPINVATLSQAAEAAGVRLGVLVEVNIGHNRCGVAPFDPTLALVKQVLQSPGLQFKGLMGYDGHCTTKVSETERGPLALAANTMLVQNRHYVEAAGIPVEIVSGSGTFTYRYACDVAGITEIQAGSYLLMDTAFRDFGVREFECTLSVLATIISTPTYPAATFDDGTRLAIIDTGRKSLNPSYGLPEVKSPTSGVALRSLSDEHGRVLLSGDGEQLQIGDKIELWVRDANGTIQQFDRLYAIRNDHIEAIWKIPLLGVST